MQFIPDIVVIDSDDTNDGHLRDVFTFVYGTVDMTEQTTQPNNTLDQVLIQIPSVSQTIPLNSISLVIALFFVVDIN